MARGRRVDDRHDADFYSVTVSAGRTIRAGFDVDPSFAQVTVFDSGGNPVAQGDGFSSLPSFTNNGATGTFYVAVTSTGPGFSYALAVMVL